jgi:hypothetical protein
MLFSPYSPQESSADPKSPTSEANLHDYFVRYSLLSDLGISTKSLNSTFYYILDRLAKQMKSDNENQIEVLERQANIIFNAVHLTMHGLLCVSLIHDIEALYPLPEPESRRDSTLSAISHEFDDLIHSNIRKSSFSRISLYNRQTYLFTSEDKDTEFNRGKEVLKSDRLSIPMIFPALLYFVDQNIIPMMKRLQFYLSLKVSLQNFENYDCLLKYPCWQMSILKSLLKEQMHINVIRGIVIIKLTASRIFVYEILLL